MKKLTFISCLLLSGCLAGAMAANKKQPIYKDAKAPIEERVNDLVSRMTLEEKVQQLNQYTLGRNNNENNRGEKSTGSVPFIPSLWDKHVLGIPNW